MADPTLILGAGLTGLSCAYHLGDPYRLIEKQTEVGGLAKTHKRPNGFLCDGTGHWLHLGQEYTKKLVHDLLPDNLAFRERRARVFSKGVFTLYPFQANTAGLPAEVIEECLLGLIRARYEEQHADPKNYQEWIRQQFGEGIAQHFMFPYNRKIYGVPLSELAADFARRYIPQPKIESVLKGALGRSKEALGYNARFLYPERGGIGALSEALHQGLDRPAECGREPTSIDIGEKTVLLEDGERFSFSRLVNTIPLPNLIELLVNGRADSVPETIVSAAKELRANSVLYFDVALRGAPGEHQDYHWIYVPEQDLPFYRIGSYSAVEPSLAPANCRSYYVELGHFGEVDPTRFEQGVIDGLRRVGILEDESEIIFIVPNVLAPAYVLFDHQYQRARQAVLSFLEESGIISVGRYGRWQYNAMEDALLEGREAALTIKGEAP